MTAPEPVPTPSLSDADIKLIRGEPAAAAALDLLEAHPPDLDGIPFRVGLTLSNLQRLGLLCLVPPPEKAPSTTVNGKQLKLKTEDAPYSQGNPRPGKPRPVLVCLEDVEAEEVDWLWEGRFPAGTVSMIVGDPGVGKSTFIGSLIAVITAGRDWPDGAGHADRGSVLVLQAEESIASTLRPRLDALGAESAKVHFLTAVRDGRGDEHSFSLAADITALETALDDLGDVRLILIDPLGSYIRGISGNNEAETRDLLRPLFKLAEARRVAVVAIAHLNKDGDKDFLYRASGSIAFIAMSRAAWYLSHDPNDPERRLLSLVKGNVEGLTRTALAFGYEHRRVTWYPDPVQLDARQVDNLLQKRRRDEKLYGGRGRDRKAVARAKEFLIKALSSGPSLQSALQERALQVGIKESSFRKALKDLLADDGRFEMDDHSRGDGRKWVQSRARAEPTRAPDVIPPADPIAVWLDDGGALGGPEPG